MIYVDNMRAEFGRMRMCHMIADTHEELMEIADKLRLDRRWIQKRGKPDEHFDVCLSHRRTAVQLGAIEVDSRKLVEIIQRKRSHPHKEEGTK